MGINTSKLVVQPVEDMDFPRLQAFFKHHVEEKELVPAGLPEAAPLEGKVEEAIPAPKPRAKPKNKSLGPKPQWIKSTEVSCGKWRRATATLLKSLKQAEAFIDFDCTDFGGVIEISLLLA